jgi:probable phosphoglycerate mutase
VATTIILVRHSAHDLLDRVLVGRRLAVPLSEAGIEQAEHLAAGLVRRGVAHVKSSPQLRARQTAQPIASMLGRTTEIMPEFDEMDFGEWTGRTFHSLQDDHHWQRWNSQRETCRPPGGESMRELQTRVLYGLERVAAALAGQCLAIVTHAEPARAAVLHYRGISLGEFARVQIDPGACITMRVEGNKVSIIRENERVDTMMLSA